MYSYLNISGVSFAVLIESLSEGPSEGSRVLLLNCRFVVINLLFSTHSQHLISIPPFSMELSICLQSRCPISEGSLSEYFDASSAS